MDKLIKTHIKCHRTKNRQKYLEKEEQTLTFPIEKHSTGHLGSSVVEDLPLAQVVIPGSWVGVQHRVSRREPAFPSAYVSASLSLSLSLSLVNK